MTGGRYGTTNFGKIRRELGSATDGLSVTRTLYVHLNGNNSDGLTWESAYNTLQAALEVASLDPDELTLLMIGPNVSGYDIDTAGDPTYSGNYVFNGSYRNWVHILNSNGSANSVLKFTGKIAFDHITIDIGATDNDGIIIDGTAAQGARLNHVYIEGENATGACEGITLSGGVEYVRFDDVLIHGDGTNLNGMLINNSPLGHFHNLEMHHCNDGLKIANAASDFNEFHRMVLHDCVLGINIDAGNEQFFDDILFDGCTDNIDDEVGGHFWTNIKGQFPTAYSPTTMAGVTVTAGVGANTWSAAGQEIRAAATAAPFRVLGVVLEAAVDERYQVKLNDGTTDFAIFTAQGTTPSPRSSPTNMPSGTDFIFNKGVSIDAYAKSESGSNNIQVTVLVQEI